MSDFLKNLSVKVLHLAAGVYLSEAPDLPPPVTNCMNTCAPVLIHTRKGGGGSDEPVRRLEGVLVHKRGRKYQHDCIYKLY
jgi:hypothetical protein